MTREVLSKQVKDAECGEKVKHRGHQKIKHDSKNTERLLRNKKKQYSLVQMYKNEINEAKNMHRETLKQDDSIIENL